MYSILNLNNLSNCKVILSFTSFSFLTSKCLNSYIIKQVQNGFKIEKIIYSLLKRYKYEKKNKRIFYKD